MTLDLTCGCVVCAQLEQAHGETQRLLNQERSTRTLQENLLSSHIRKQQEIEEENKRNKSKSSEVIKVLWSRRRCFSTKRFWELSGHGTFLQELKVS